MAAKRTAAELSFGDDLDLGEQEPVFVSFDDLYGGVIPVNPMAGRPQPQLQPRIRGWFWMWSAE
jgi:hypothetical protein